MKTDTPEIDIQIAVSDVHCPAAAQLAEWAQHALADGQHELTLRVVSQQEIQTLNRQYRQQDKPTNVLSFPYEPIPGVTTDLLGDVVLCADIIHQEALAQGKSDDAHWAHMVIHGVLHLLGHDHQDDTEAETMEALETQLVTELGFAAPYGE